MPWVQLIFTIAEIDCQQYTDLLESVGALSVTLADAGNQPLYEPPPGETPHWRQTRVIGLFGTDINIPQIINRMKQAVMPAALANWQVEALPDKEWVSEWTKDFHPLQFGENIWVCPSWCPPPDPDATNIFMDPGLAFGSGTHATTSLCISWLAENKPIGMVVVDYGCGSGILGITALKLGAKQVWAIDNDEQALLATQNNAKNNCVDSKIYVSLPESAENILADVLIANILAQPLVELAPQLATMVKPNGHIVLSGILPSQIEQIEHAYRPWFEIKPATVKDDWVRIEGLKK